MTSKILKSTPRGQITLPKKWREHAGTDHYVLHMEDNKLVIVPFHVDNTAEEIVFDADRDNHGKGVTPEEMIRMLKKIKNG